MLELTFKEMSEEEAVKAFQQDGYFDYAKRAMRYKQISPESKWARQPATMFVAYHNDVPVGVAGFSRFGKFLLGAGMHVRKEYRGKGIGAMLVDKVLSEKGGKTLLINIANPNLVNLYRRKGFIDMEKETLPEELLQPIEGKEFADQVQKWVLHRMSSWEETLRVGR